MVGRVRTCVLTRPHNTMPRSHRSAWPMCEGPGSRPARNLGCSCHPPRAADQSTIPRSRMPRLPYVWARNMFSVAGEKMRRRFIFMQPIKAPYHAYACPGSPACGQGSELIKFQLRKIRRRSFFMQPIKPPCHAHVCPGCPTCGQGSKLIKFQLRKIRRRSFFMQPIKPPCHVHVCPGWPVCGQGIYLLCARQLWVGNWKYCGAVQASYGCLVGHVFMGVRISVFAP
jgi:hypothetical protein